MLTIRLLSIIIPILQKRKTEAESEGEPSLWPLSSQFAAPSVSHGATPDLIGCVKHEAGRQLVLCCIFSPLWLAVLGHLNQGCHMGGWES